MYDILADIWELEKLSSMDNIRLGITPNDDKQR